MHFQDGLSWTQVIFFQVIDEIVRLVYTVYQLKLLQKTLLNEMQVISWCKTFLANRILD